MAFDIGLGRLLVAGASMILLTSCTVPPQMKMSLGQALLKETGYELGPENPAYGTDGAACAAESRYQGDSGPILMLVCVAPLEKEDRRIRYRINYSPPEACRTKVSKPWALLKRWNANTERPSQRQTRVYLLGKRGLRILKLKRIVMGCRSLYGIGP